MVTKRFYKSNYYTIKMLRLIIFFISMLSSYASCNVGHEEFWKCALKDRCLNAFQLHAKMSRSKSSSRPFILAIEGPKYNRLYKDCDVNKDGCIEYNDILKAGNTCKRSCIWRDTMHKMLCHG